MKHRSLRGRLAYFRHDDGEKREYGRESFALTWHEDGQCTLSAHCEIEAGVIAPRDLIRDVVYTMDSCHRPLDCYVRLQHNGKFYSAGWLRFTDEMGICDVRNVEFGDVHQEIPLRQPALSLGAHPISCDPFHLARFDHLRGEKVQRQLDVWMTSLDHDGGSGPLLQKIDIDIEYVGRERIVVPAGTFDTAHYRFIVAGAFPREHPVEDVWCHPENFSVVKIAVGGYMSSTFELMELTSHETADGG